MWCPAWKVISLFVHFYVCTVWCRTLNGKVIKEMIIYTCNLLLLYANAFRNIWNKLVNKLRNTIALYARHNCKMSDFSSSDTQCFFPPCNLLTRVENSFCNISHAANHEREMYRLETNTYTRITCNRISQANATVQEILVSGNIKHRNCPQLWVN